MMLIWIILIPMIGMIFLDAQGPATTLIRTVIESMIIAVWTFLAGLLMGIFERDKKCKKLASVRSAIAARGGCINPARNTGDIPPQKTEPNTSAMLGDYPKEDAMRKIIGLTNAGVNKLKSHLMQTGNQVKISFDQALSGLIVVITSQMNNPKSHLSTEPWYFAIGVAGKTYPKSADEHETSDYEEVCLSYYESDFQIEQNR